MTSGINWFRSLSFWRQNLTEVAWGLNLEQDSSHTVEALSEVTIAQKATPSEGYLVTFSLSTRGGGWGMTRAG